MKSESSNHHAAGISRVGFLLLLLAVVTLIPYWQVKNHAFISYDDDQYITKNLAIQKGLTLDAIGKSFHSGYAANWHPLTWISHMIDCRLFGLNSGAHHLVNLLFHILNTLLLFLVLRAMTGGMWKSAFIAALFALHPMHVESVAWAAERKDVLSAFFWMLTMGSYLWYVRNKGIFRYALVVLCYALGLMAKPMLVTLPVVLLLLDIWPLRRIGFGNPGKPPVASRKNNAALKNAGAQPAVFETPKNLLLEKIPLFLPAIVSSIVTIIVQKTAGAVADTSAYPIGPRFTNAIVSYGLYVFKMFIPVNMSIFYPHVTHVEWAGVLFSLLLIAGMTFLSFKFIRTRPYVLTGWLWFLITLVPVIGLIQVGSQAMADRYTYLPYIGLFMTVTWGASDWMGGTRFGQRTLATMGIVFLLVFGIVTGIQVGYWKDSITVFTHALKVTKDNYIAYANLGIVSEAQGNTDQAVDYYEKALTINSNLVDVNNNLANIFSNQGKKDWAIQCYEKAVKISPKNYKIYFNIGNAYKDEAKPQEAIVQYKKALSLDSTDENVFFNLGIALEAAGDLDDAIARYEKALKIKPDYADVHNNLGIALAKKGRMDEAIVHFKEALRIKPDFVMAKGNLDRALGIAGQKK